MYLFNNVIRDRLFLYLLQILLIVCVGFFYTHKTLMLYILFELSVPPTLFLIILYGYQPEKLSAGSYLLLYTVLSSLPILVAILSLPTYLCSMIVTSASFITLSISIGFIVKTPLYLVHMWLPKAHVEAPVAGRIVLAGVLLKLGSYGLITFMPFFTNKFLLFYLYISIVGGVLCCITCSRQ